MPIAPCIAIVGAESTGKTTLARTLAEGLAQSIAGVRVAWVPELLREWCDSAGRTPLQHEQLGIARGQHQRIRAAAATHELVVCDTTALMTAVYSRIVFGDHSLDPLAVALHRETTLLTLLTALDLPWVSDGLQRDGPQVREPVDTALRTLMQAQGIDFCVIAGGGATRTDNALAAAMAALRGREVGASASRRGLFSRLGESTSANDMPATPRRWICDCCNPEAERALLRRPT